MGIISGFIGLTVAFVLIAIIILWTMIRSNIHIVAKILIIPLVIWYSIVLFYTPNKLLGWPTPELFPEGARVITFLIIEPTQVKSGGFYFWLIDDLHKDISTNIIDNINPKQVFSYTETDTPRVYYMPYDRAFHKQMIKKRKKQGEIKGIMRLYHKMVPGKKTKNKGRNTHKNDGKYEIKVTDPSTLLKKLGKDAQKLQ